MKRAFPKTFFFFAAFLLADCTSLQRRSDVTYEKDVLPVIIEQINKTASTFFYDMEKLNSIRISKGIPIDKDEKTPKNVVVGNNEIGGVCQDYASHFIDNYEGLGEVYYLKVDVNGEAVLQRRVKQFEKSDIIISDITPIYSFIERIYQRIVSHAEKEGSSFKWENKQYSTFYTKTINGIIYHSEQPFDSNTYLVPFEKEHIKIHQKNYQEERNKQKEKEINRIYSMIIRDNEDNKEFTNWENSHNRIGGWHIEPLKFHTNKDGKLFLIEETSIPTPEFHAGKEEEEKFFNHAWVRIIWRGMTIDVEPTWYDNGIPIEWAIEEIIPNEIDSYNGNNVLRYPYIYSNYPELSNTHIISPKTGTLKSGSAQTFVISSKDYSEFSIVMDDELNNLLNNFRKNYKTENYEATLTVPKNIDTIEIYGVTTVNNRRNGVALVRYKVMD
jgi:hypothetical protein